MNLFRCKFLKADCIIYIFFRKESRQRGRFAGFSVYVSNDGERESLCYKDGPELPPLNFTITCNRSGRYVRFYNERLDGVTYPTGYKVSSNVVMELCEVIVYGKALLCIRDRAYFKRHAIVQ